MIQIVNGNYIRRTASGVMKCGPSLSFGSKSKNAEWDEHYKKVDAKIKRDKEGHGYWAAGAPYKWVRRCKYGRRIDKLCIYRFV